MENYQAQVDNDDVTGIDFDFENKQSCNKLLTAVINGDEKLVKKLLRSNWSPNTCDNVGRTALHLAARSSTTFNIMKMLLDSGGYVDHITHSGATALCLASYAGLHNTVSLLLDHGADVNIKNNVNANALHFACNARHPNIQVIRLLLDAGVDVNSQDDFDTTPLMLAAQNKSQDTVRYLIDKGANVMLKDTDEKTVFHMAASSDDVETLNSLVVSVPGGVSVGDIADSEGFTLLMFAAQSNAANTVSRLLELGCDTSKYNKHGLIALHFAAHNSERCFQLLLDGTPHDVINEKCESTNRLVRSSLPCLLIDAEFLNGLKLLFSKKGLKDSVLNCPLVKLNFIFPPLAFLFHTCDSPDFSKSVVELYMNKKLPLDPLINANPPEYVHTCLETLITSHYVDHAMTQELSDSCHCAQLFIKMLESGARADPYCKLSGEIEKNNILFNFCVHNSLFGLSYLLRYSNYLEPFQILQLLTKYIIKSNLGISPFVKTITFLCRYCCPWEVDVCKRLVSQHSVIDVQQCYNVKNYPFPSLKHICRSAVRSQRSKSCYQIPSVESMDFSGVFLQNLHNFCLPEALISYLQFDDVILDTKTHPREFALNSMFLDGLRQRRLRQ